MDKRFIGVLLAIVLIFVGFAFLGSKKSSAPSSSNTKSVTLTNHITGNTKSKVLLVEYGDYQCPACEQYSATVKQIVDANKAVIRFQFRNFPLVNLHQNAFAASRAAEAASLQGKFWEMHDLLYEMSNWAVWSQSNAPSTYFNQYANQLGLKLTKFKTDFASDKVNSAINADMAEGNRLGITSTPSFFLDGKQVQLNNDPAAFQKAIDAELAKTASKTSSTSTSQ